MTHTLLCPRMEICPIYSAYVEQTKDDTFGIICMETIENRVFYSCTALNTVLELFNAKQLSEEMMRRIEGLLDCFLIEQANKQVPKRRADF
ncbi:MAG: hypothetical protein JW828_14695 [Sedimentisphaerales bacterium]|nr:hypothetical protein [Sedimentisphaerales bacterium]